MEQNMAINEVSPLEIADFIKSIRGLKKWFNALPDSEIDAAIVFVHEVFFYDKFDHEAARIVNDSILEFAIESSEALDALSKLAEAAGTIFALNSLPHGKKKEFAALYNMAVDFSKYYKFIKSYKKSREGWRIFTEGMLSKVDSANKTFSKELKLTKTDIYKIISPIYNGDYSYSVDGSECVSVDSIGQYLLSRKKTGISSR
jgi:hypothetical protein